jgi:tripartite-type tricarboxylate transporter receptor subunit TctC
MSVKSKRLKEHTTGKLRTSLVCTMAALGALMQYTDIASAQSYPTRPVRLIVPAATGGGLDTMGRVVAQALSPMWNQQVVVDNRPGAGVMLGTEMASKAAPDGYTLLVLNANLAPNAILHDKVGVARSLAAVIKIADLPNALSIPTSLPVSSVKELVALARSSKLSYGSAGHGTVGNIATEMLKLAIRADITHVPYKGGGPVMTALIGGEVSMGVVSLASTMPQVKTGRVKILAVVSGKRSRLAPEIPTVAESVPGVELESWVGLFAPGGTPPQVLRTLNAHVLKAVQLPDVHQRLTAQGYEVQGSTPEEFAKLVRSDLEKYARVIREAGIKTH